MRPLPTLLGSLIFLAGALAFVRTSPTPSAPEPLVQAPLPTPRFQAELVQVRADGSEARTRQTLTAPEARAAQIEVSLRALRGWLMAASSWPPALRAPHVFLVGEDHAVLDFPLRGSPRVSAAQEAQLLVSVERTLALQGVSNVTVLVNGGTSSTFLGHLTLTDALEP